VTSDDERPPGAPDVPVGADQPAAEAPAWQESSQAGAVPDADALAAIATPATVRRAPRIGRFIGAGVLVGVVVGWISASVASGTSGEARTLVVLVTTAALALLGGLIGAWLGTSADRRSRGR
jgi:hypothetical protein